MEKTGLNTQIQDVGGAPEKTFLRCLQQTYLLTFGTEPTQLLHLQLPKWGERTGPISQQQATSPRAGTLGSSSSSALQQAWADSAPDHGATDPVPHHGVATFAESKSQRFMRLAAGRPRYTALLTWSTAGSNRHTSDHLPGARKLVIQRFLPQSVLIGPVTDGANPPSPGCRTAWRKGAP